MKYKNLLKGIPWRFGANWPGKRCEAKTRKGTRCQRPAKLPVGRCRIHGGASTGPRTEAGLSASHRLILNMVAIQKSKKAKAKARAQLVREIWKELKEIENWGIEQGYLKKNWRKDFYI